MRRSPDGAAVETSGLSKRYGRTVALEDVALQVPEGSFYVLVGENGAGKSSLLEILMNLERAQSGTATILGLDSVEQGARARAQVGYIPEHHRQLPRWMKCGDLLRHVARYHPAWDEAYADQLVDRFGLKLDRRAGSQSKGEARRLQFALALAHRPPLLLLDEPTDGLDPLIRSRTMSLLVEHLADSPTTVLVSTHRVQELDSLADHIGVLQEGRLVAQMSRDDLLRTVRRYRLEVPEGWQPPPDLRAAEQWRASTGRAMQATLIGEEEVVVARVTASDATVVDTTTLSLEEAAVALLAEAAR